MVVKFFTVNNTSCINLDRLMFYSTVGTHVTVHDETQTTFQRRNVIVQGISSKFERISSTFNNLLHIVLYRTEYFVFLCFVSQVFLVERTFQQHGSLP